MDSRLSTGISHLDRYLNGGIPKGSIVTIATDPVAEGELLFRNFAFQRPILYLTTVRTPEAIEERLRKPEGTTTRGGASPPAIDAERQSPPLTVVSLDLDDPLTEIADYLSKLKDNCNIIISSLNRLEMEDEGRYTKFLKQVEKKVIEGGHTCLFHVLEDSTRNNSGGTNRIYTHEVSDSIWQLSCTGERAETNYDLSVEKNRFGPRLTDPLQVRFDDGVHVECSRRVKLS